MKVSKVFKYNMWVARKTMMVFWLVITLISAFMVILNFTVAANESEGVSFTLDMSMLITLFVFGIILFTENLKMFLQNGISRKSMFMGTVLSYVGITAIFTVVAQVYQYILVNLLNFGRQSSILGILYDGYLSGFNSITRELLMLAATFGIGLFLIAIGFFFAVLFSRFSKFMKVIVPTSFVLVCAVILPLIDRYLVNGAIFKALGNFAGFITGASNGFNINYLTVSMLVFAVIFMGLNWLLLRRSEIKDK